MASESSQQIQRYVFGIPNEIVNIWASERVINLFGGFVVVDLAKLMQKNEIKFIHVSSETTTNDWLLATEHNSS